LAEITSTDGRDELILERAAEDNFRLFEREADNGQTTFEWRWGKRRYPGPEFLSRRHAIDWMADYLAGDTPGHGIDRRELHG
jgi:hypothetical protein